MKKLLTTLLGLAVLGLASVSLATPVYTGLTEADFGTGDTGLPGAPDSNAAGYYLWTTGDTWSVRWTGNDFGTTTIEDWFGFINLFNLVDGSVNEVRFDLTGDTLTVIDAGFMDIISFTGVAGPHYDGFDFSLDSSNLSVVDFALGSSMFSSLMPGSADVAGTNIFIGQDFNTPLVQVQELADGRIVQRFEVARVPEPGTLLLMGIGLLGLGFSRRRNKV